MCQLSIEHQRGKVIDQLFLCIHLSILNFVVVVCGVNLSLEAEVMCISVSTGFLESFSNDPCTGITNDFDCCLHQLSVHVGKCSIARP